MCMLTLFLMFFVLKFLVVLLDFWLPLLKLIVLPWFTGCWTIRCLWMLLFVIEALLSMWLQPHYYYCSSLEVLFVFIFFIITWCHKCFLRFNTVFPLEDCILGFLAMKTSIFIKEVDFAITPIMITFAIIDINNNVGWEWMKGFYFHTTNDLCWCWDIFCWLVMDVSPSCNNL